MNRIYRMKSFGEDVAFELGQLVHEEHTVMGEGDLAGGWVDVAAEEAGVGGLLRTRQWHRGTTTTNIYYKFADLIRIGYSDSTAQVRYTNDSAFRENP
jgi:hypothetical protein